MFTGRDTVERESIRMMQLQDEEVDALSEERRTVSGDAKDVSGLKPGTPPGWRLRAGTGWLAGHED
jgi:hypothetical protein